MVLPLLQVWHRRVDVGGHEEIVGRLVSVEVYMSRRPQGTPEGVVVALSLTQQQLFARQPAGLVYVRRPYKSLLSPLVDGEAAQMTFNIFQYSFRLCHGDVVMLVLWLCVNAGVRESVGGREV